MNRKLEMTVTNRDAAIRELESFQNNKHIFVESGFNEAQIDAIEREKQDAWDKANNEFWEVFKFPLEVFDLENGDLPDDDERVYVLDDINGDWREVTISYAGREAHFITGCRVFQVERYHRWIRLPTLKELNK